MITKINTTVSARYCDFNDRNSEKPTFKFFDAKIIKDLGDGTYLARGQIGLSGDVISRITMNGNFVWIVLNLRYINCAGKSESEIDAAVANCEV